MKQFIVLQREEKIEVWGSITDICNAHKEMKYSYVRGLKFPFTYKGVKFSKVHYKTQMFI